MPFNYCVGIGVPWCFRWLLAGEWRDPEAISIQRKGIQLGKREKKANKQQQQPAGTSASECEINHSCARRKSNCNQPRRLKNNGVGASKCARALNHFIPQSAASRSTHRPEPSAQEHKSHTLATPHPAPVSGGVSINHPTEAKKSERRSATKKKQHAIPLCSAALADFEPPAPRSLASSLVTPAAATAAHQTFKCCATEQKGTLPWIYFVACCSPVEKSSAVIDTNSMGQTDMKSTRGKKAVAVPQSRRSGLLGQEKPVHLGDPAELTRVKLQDPIKCPPDSFSSSMWSADGITRPSRLYQRSSSTPPSHQAIGRSSSLSYGMPREDMKPGSQLPCHLSDPSKRNIDYTKDNQIGESETGVRCSPASIGMDIQRSWSAPPIAEQNGPFEDNQEEEQDLSPLNLDKLKCKDLVPELLCRPRDGLNDVWSKQPQRNQYSFLCASPDHSDTHVVSDLSYDSTPGYSNQDSNVSSSACSVSSSHDKTPELCRLPPGLSLVDRLQEEFSSAPAHIYGSVSASSCNSLFPRDGIDGMERLRIDDQVRCRRDDAGHSSVYSFSDMRHGRQDAQDFRFAGNFQQSRTLNRSASQPAYANASYSTPSPFAVHPHPSPGFRGRPTAIEQPKYPWGSSEDNYYTGTTPVGASAAEFDFPAHRTGSNYQPRLGGIYGAMKASERQVRGHQSYLPARPAHGFDPRDAYQNAVPHPSSLYRSRSGSSRRVDYEMLHPVAHSYSSTSLLEEFNSASRSDKWELSAIKGHLLLFARDQSGSRFIQQKLEKADEQTKNDAFEEIFPNALVLMTDVFGNYVIQKFFEHGSVKQQQLLVEQMRANMISLALQVYGCRVIQRALEVTQVEEQLALIKELRGHVLKCITDQNGNHVLQKCVEAASWKRSVESGENLGMRRRVTGEDIQFIIDDIVGNAAGYSTHSYGCRVIQRILEHCSPAQIRSIVSEIVLKCRDLVKDQFGNYVVQHVISHGEPDQRRVVMDAVFPEIGRWSQHKYASNVVEACLDRATKAEIARTIDFILQCDETGSSCPLLPMMKHMYGNYVVQKLLDKADPADRERIVCIIRHNADYLKRFTFGKHVLSRLERESAASYY